MRILKSITFLAFGIVFGVVMAKSEAISWYRIQEMFRFQSIHMYGIIGTAVVCGTIGVQLIKRFNLRDFSGQPIRIAPKDRRLKRAIFGGLIFGFGWALTGACPGPMFVNIGYGFVTFLVVIIAALIGTATYGAIRDKLPH